MPAIRFRGAAVADLGELHTVAGTPELQATDLAALADPPLSHLETPAVRLLWGAKDLDEHALAEHLGRVSTALGELLPWLPKPSSPPLVVVLVDDEGYRDYVERFARAFNAKVRPPEGDGFTLHGVATGSWDPAQGAVRPSFTHEYVHAWFAASAGLSAGEGDWLQEGLASLVQLRFHPQENVAGIICKGLTDEHYRMPLADLVDGRRLPMKRYWQAATLVEHLLSVHGDATPALVKALYAVGSPDLLPHLGPVFGTSVEDLEREWMGATSARYCSAKSK